ncbi:MAG: nicotinamide-nucleotide adenylyltransferase, partial [Promethearchaeota archaeon]
MAGEEVAEVIACFRVEDLPKFETGKIDTLVFPEEREKAHASGIPHIVTRVFAVNPNGEYLVQHRAPTRASNPDVYTDSASGHVTYEPRLDFEKIRDNAIRELREEVGVDALLLKFRGTYYEPLEWELVYVFLAVVPPEMSIQTEEVTEKTRFVTGSELRALLANSEFVPKVAELWSEITKNGELVSLLREQFNVRDPESATTGQDRPTHEPETSRSALFIGRFQPFHEGHLKVVEWILSRHPRVIIGIGSAQAERTRENPFSYEEREEFVKAALLERGIDSTRFEVIAIPDEFDARRWVEKILEKLDPSQLVFYSNSDWTRALFESKGVQVAGKKFFNFGQFNGTTVRELVLGGGDWEVLVPPAVAEFMRRKGREILKQVYVNQ